MRGGAPRLLAAAVSAAVVASALTACSSDDAVVETPAVRHLEASIAGFAESHRDVITAAGGDQPGGCAVRLLGQSQQADHERRAYIELYCSSFSSRTHCPTDSDSAGVGAAVATLAADGRVSGIAVDDLNDEAYNQWIDKHFAANLRDLETSGPQFGDLLERRVKHAHRC